MTKATIGVQPETKQYFDFLRTEVEKFTASGKDPRVTMPRTDTADIFVNGLLDDLQHRMDSVEQIERPIFAHTDPAEISKSIDIMLRQVESGRGMIDRAVSALNMLHKMLAETEQPTNRETET